MAKTNTKSDNLKKVTNLEKEIATLYEKAERVLDTYYELLDQENIGFVFSWGNSHLVSNFRNSLLSMSMKMKSKKSCDKLVTKSSTNADILKKITKLEHEKSIINIAIGRVCDAWTELSLSRNFGFCCPVQSNNSNLIHDFELAMFCLTE